ncbi:MAG: ANTAR domain-containing protein [Acidimicrobiia bacterium]
MTNGSAREYSDYVNQAIGMVAEQTRSTIAQAIALMEERAAANGQTLEHIAEAVIDRSIRFDDR